MLMTLQNVLDRFPGPVGTFEENRPSIIELPFYTLREILR
jgi:hypothetical protein